jgi:hypothetical protein
MSTTSSVLGAPRFVPPPTLALAAYIWPSVALACYPSSLSLALFRLLHEVQTLARVDAFRTVPINNLRAIFLEGEVHQVDHILGSIRDIHAYTTDIRGATRSHPRPLM